MRYQPMPAQVHIANRRAFAAAIGDEAIAIIDTADKIVRRGDAEIPFRPDSNFYYLTGIDEPEAVLVLVPGQANPAGRELLFISGTTDHIGQWEGDRHDGESAAALSGIQAVLPLDQLPFYLSRLLEQFRIVYLNADESLVTPGSHPARRRAADLRQAAPLHDYRSALPLLDRQRAIKAPEEVVQIRRATAITKAAIAKAQSIARPGLYEDELEAEIIAEYLRSGARAAWSPIVAAGQNSTVIHYSANRHKLGAHDVVLIDTGAEYGYYSADVSRTFAVTEFTPRQQAVYNAVKRIQEAGIKLHKPGESVHKIDLAMQDVMKDEIAKLGLKGDLREYYPHISHHLGLDVHDLAFNASTRLAFEPGMVVTCEPGLYLPEEGIGVRLEDDILITESGYEVL